MIEAKDLVLERPLYEGVQKLYRFENGYGASVVRHLTSYGGRRGLWELAVIHWDDNELDPIYDEPIFHLVYDTPITYDVLGYLEDSEIEPILEKIKSLNKFGQFEED